MIRQRQQRSLGPDDSRSGTRRRHGLRPDEVAALLASQGGRCALCRRSAWGAQGPLIDHDHKLAEAHPHPVSTGCKACLRGLLCQNCNVGIGMLQDDPDLLMKAAAYVAQRWRAV